MSREITTDVDLCLPDGRLNPLAIGWSRRPLHRCNLEGPWGRQKRWDYWAVATDAFALSITYADVDYLGLAALAFFDFSSGRVTEHGTARPLGRGFVHGERADAGDISFTGSGLSLSIRREAGGARLQAAFRDVIADVRVECDDDESLNVVVPWSERRFQFTSKQTALLARGTVSAGAVRHEFSRGFATLDYGRGVWPYRTTWNWANAAGIEHDRRIGLQLGGKWTDGTGQTENGLLLDGRLHKIDEDVIFSYDRRRFKEPWTLRSRRVDLRFTPCLHHHVRAPLLVASAELNLCFGHFSGTVFNDANQPIAVERLLGWAEEFRGRW